VAITIYMRIIVTSLQRYVLFIYFLFFFLMPRLPPRSTLFPYTTLFRSKDAGLTKIDHVLITHWHIDHFGGVAEVAQQLPIGTLRSEEHTSELQSLRHLVCRLLLEKKKHRRQRECNTNRADSAWHRVGLI